MEAPAVEPWRLVEMLSEQPFFDAAVVTGDDLNRAEEYKAQAQRAELASSVGSRDEFLASLGIVCTFQSALQAPLARAVQLLAKTNQFNLTTRRRSAAEVEEFAAAPGGQAFGGASARPLWRRRGGGAGTGAQARRRLAISIRCYYRVE